MGQISFDDLLGGENEAIPSSPTASTSSPLHDKVKAIVLEGVGSAIEVCEILITSGIIPKDRYSTGKPISYGKVCLILDDLVKSGEMEFIEDQNKKDRIYLLKKNESESAHVR